ncbi:MAG TPA: GNAT family N-acetyltransferase [Chitinophaga sp.]|uniref:GNAT family N-acetyltransferase n=1 Tax=Chitinophaga sp. TaxID=1869181 RepID=UPI002C9E3D57|nr:GNAT family N-acetyltransferase [Chitinophaga sp.]HVI48661.1 GNAT family N-acetyltransferase [Chitinophaga sp.]
MEAITITKADISHLPVLRPLCIQTFTDTYASKNTAANMQAYVADHFSEERLSKELQHPDMGYYLAWEGPNLIGYTKLNTGAAQTELQAGNGLEIERIYVLQSFQGRQTGRLLCEKAEEVARVQGRPYIWLGAWDQNIKAIGFYERVGFVAFDRHVFVLGDDHQTDIMMKKMLS